MMTPFRSLCLPGILLALALQSVSTRAAQPDSPRERISLDADWRFVKGDPIEVGETLRYSVIKDSVNETGAAFTTNTQARSFNSSELTGMFASGVGGGVSYTKPDFNDTGWRAVNLPHDWGIEGPFSLRNPGSTGRLPWWGVGWYRKHFTLPASDLGRRVSIEIDGAMAYATVWLNGHFVGGWPYGYSTFCLDLTRYIKPGADNVVAIRLDNPPNSSRWYPGGGIYRNVWLVKTSPVHVGQWGSYITTPEISKDAASVKLKVAVENDGDAIALTKVATQFYALDSAGKRTGRAVAAIEPTDLVVQPNATVLVSTDALIRNPKLWSIQTPNRYVAVTTVEKGGQIVDTYETPFGIRSITFTATNGFLLNGERVPINGVCDHHDIGALGAAINVRALERQIQLLKEMGCNAIRTSHNPPAPELLDLCDRLGMLVMDESFDCWLSGKTANDYHLLFADWHEKDLRAEVRRDRNHPSIILWSIGNEIGEQGQGERGAAIARELTRIVHEEDLTRPTIAACNSARPGSPFAAAIDVIGLNYQGSRYSPQQPYGNYLAFHESSPDKFVIGSETASTISSRGEYAFPVAAQPGAVSDPPGRGRRGGARNPATNAAPTDIPGRLTAIHQMSSYDLYYPSWATSPDTEFASHDRYPFVAGEFVWTGFDYLGEPTPWGGGNDPSRSSYFGILDLAGFKKDRFYLYQAYWRPELPMAHILPHWNWPDRLGMVTPVHVYTSGDEAELFLNGKSLGRKKKAQFEYRLRWDDVKYEPGELKVIAYKNGKKWAQDVVKTTGPAEKLKIEADRSTIETGAQDLSYVTVSVEDKSGLLVPLSKNHLVFDISGPGQIAAVDNGDPTSLVPFQSKEMDAFNGLCLVIVRSTTKSGQITLKATSPGLAPAEVKIRAKAP